MTIILLILFEKVSSMLNLNTYTHVDNYFVLNVNI